MTKTQSKIFVGLTNIASILSDIKHTFAALGVEAITAVHQNHAGNIIHNQVDYDFSQMKHYWFGGVRPRFVQKKLQERWLKPEDRIWRKAVKECGTFVFIWNTFQPNYEDIAALKKMGKKVINVFVGDDVRWHKACAQEYVHFSMYPPEYDQADRFTIQDLTQRLRFLRTAEKQADFIFSRLDQAQLALRPYHRWNMMVNPGNIIENPSQRKQRPVIAHAPSNRKAKGSDYLLQALDQLEKEGVEFELKLIEGVTHKTALQMYQDADILVDQLLFPGTGKLSTEGLASGCVVLSHMAYDKYPQNNPADCPIIDVDPDNVYQQLKDLIPDYARREKLAKQGRTYVEQHLDVKYFCEKILQLISGEKLDYDYTPSFFRQHFVPGSEEASILYNQWTDFVKDCDWYQQYVPEGERAGLKF